MKETDIVVRQRALGESTVKSSDLVLSVVGDLKGLQALAPEWDRLVLAAKRPSPFLLHDWVVSWWRHFGHGATLAVVTARRVGSLVGVAPMFIRRRHGLLVCALLGDYECALGDFLVAPAEDASTAQALLDRLAQLRFDYLDVFGTPAGGVLPQLAAHGKLTVLPRVEAPVLQMPHGWDAAYTDHVGSKKRNLHRRRLSQLAKLGKISWTIARTPAEVLAEMDPVFEIHARRWHGRPDGSTFGLAAGRAFHREATTALAARGDVRLLVLRLDGRPIAFHCWFALGATMYVHRLAFDPELARFSPGQVTLLRAVSIASQEGARRIEFLGGGERYKIELADGMEPLHQILGLPSGLTASIAVHAMVLKVAARKHLKRSRLLHRFYLDGLAPAGQTLVRCFQSLH